MAHSNTVFRQLLQLLDRNEFERTERKGFRPKRRYRTLDRWGQFVAIMFAHLTNRSSLRDISSQLASQAPRLYHLGVRGVKRSTLADANHRRQAGFFQELFEQQYAKCSRFAPRKRFRFKNKLYSFDASVVDLCLSLFPWARFRATKGGIKLHALLDHDGYIPAFLEITDAKTADVTVAKTLQLAPFSIVVMDRAYVDFLWFERLTRQKVFFVTRLKRGIQYAVRERRGINGAQGVTSGSGYRPDRPQLFEIPWGFAWSRIQGPGYRTALRLSDQHLSSFAEDHRRHLPGEMAGRVVFQVDQAEPQDQELSGDE